MRASLREIDAIGVAPNYAMLELSVLDTGKVGVAQCVFKHNRAYDNLGH